jgi:hypothetical protein
LTSIASGLRWLLPIILPIFIYRAVNQDLLQALTLYLCALFLNCFMRMLGMVHQRLDLI